MGCSREIKEDEEGAMMEGRGGGKIDGGRETKGDGEGVVMESSSRWD